MKVGKITDIIQWLLGNKLKTIRIKRDRNEQKWGLLSCNLTYNNLDYDLHVDDLVMKDVTLITTQNRYGHCGVIGYADGKPVVPGQHVPDISTAKPLLYDSHTGIFSIDAKTVTSLKYMWLKSNGTAYGIN